MRPKIHLSADLIAIYSLSFGYFIINFSFLEDQNRRLIAFLLFGIAILFSLQRNINYITSAKLSKNHFIGISIILYTLIFTYLFGTHEEYGKNKFYYFILIISLSFVFIPPLFTNNKYIKNFILLLVLISLIYCIISIVFSGSDGLRRGGSGLNPALLARICMISGLYSMVLINLKGISIMRVMILMASCTAVLITGTKTPIPVAILSYFLVTTNKINIGLIVKATTILIAITILSYLALNYLIPDEISQRIINLDALSVAAQSTEGNRLELYNLALRVIAENPFGVGFGGFSTFHRFIVAPHNIFLENAIELGIISAVFFITWSLYIFKLALKNKTKDQYYIVLKVIYIYMLISLMFGGETTIQSFLLYLSGSIILLNHKMDMFKR